MGDKTAIEWTDATWNPVTGCSKVSSGCKHCYAERVFPRAYGPDRKFTDVRCHPERLDQPLRWRKSRRVFVNSMSDLFHEDVPDGFIAQVLAVMAVANQHTFQVLTKRPERMRALLANNEMAAVLAGGLACYAAQANTGIRFSQKDDGLDGICFPNVWLGVSIEDQATAEERIPVLLDTPAAVRFVSAEPLLGPVDLTSLWAQRSDGSYRWDALTGERSHKAGSGFGHPRIDWVIVGGESGPKARPMHPDWARSLRDQCVAATVPFHFKQWGEWAPPVRPHGCGRRVAGLGLPPQPIIDRDGKEHCASRFASSGIPDGFAAMQRVGKKLAGRELDGRTWDGFPETNDG